MNRETNAQTSYRHARIQHWDVVARRLDHWRGAGSYYQRLLSHYFQNLIPPGLRVLELGCSTGDLLASLRPSFGVGIDFSGEMVHRARKRHPDLEFLQADAQFLPVQGKFDAILLSDLVNDGWDVQAIFTELSRLSHRRTRIVINTYSLVWEPALKLAQRLGLSKPNLEQNWLTVKDLSNLLMLSDFELILSRSEILLPLLIPGLSQLANRYLVKIWPFYWGALTNILVARPRPALQAHDRSPSVSIVIPARNEAGNVARLLERLPDLGCSTEVVFVEGHSSDDTFGSIERAAAAYPARDIQLLKQTGKGKGDAVRLGFDNAHGEILIILDADLSVPPEDLGRFYDALASGKGEFINGVRLVYPLEEQSMRFLNLVGNKFFSLTFSWLLGQPIKDTLCGTKVLWREDYKHIASNRAYFGDFDPFGDFDLLFGATRLNLKIIDLPIRYRSRTYGRTNIDRWRHGWLLLKMVAYAAKRLKFI